MAKTSWGMGVEGVAVRVCPLLAWTESCMVSSAVVGGSWEDILGESEKEWENVSVRAGGSLFNNAVVVFGLGGEEGGVSMRMLLLLVDDMMKYC